MSWTIRGCVATIRSDARTSIKETPINSRSFGARTRRTVALGTALILGAGGLFLSSAAHAEDAVADGIPGGYDAFAQSLLADPAVQAVGRDANDQIVVLRFDGVLSTFGRSAAPSADAESIAAEQGVAVTFEDISGPLESTAATDVLGGAGYAAGTVAGFEGLCSVGFSAWTPVGNPAIVTAGHCAGDGTYTHAALTQPSLDEAFDPAAEPDILDDLGTIGFSQFGGVGNTAGADQDSTSTDIAVIDVTNPGLTLTPKVTGWSAAAAGANDLSQSVATTVKSVGVGKAGDPVSRSGRTTGLKTATITWDSVWFKVGDARYVYGFGSKGLVADSGDSGGAAFSGEKAIGIVSASTPGQAADDITFMTDLTSGLARTGGYTVMLAVDAPVLASPVAGGDVYLGESITGTGPASTTLIVTPAGGAAFEVAIGADGKWSIPVTALGEYDFTVQAKNGQFNLSAVNSYSVNVVLGAPVITSPATGTTPFDSVTSIKGTGAAGAVVTATGDVTGTATVDPSGNWSIPASLAYGDYSVSASQELGGVASAVVTSTFSVVATPAVVTSPANGSTIALADAPAHISGTGLTDAEVAVSIDGPAFASASEATSRAAGYTVTTDVVDGQWSVAVGRTLVPGVYTVNVLETVTDTVSATSTSTFTVAAAVVPEDGGNGSGGSQGGGGLATTGAADLPIGVAAALILVMGAGAVAFSRRRSADVSL